MRVHGTAVGLARHELAAEMPCTACQEFLGELSSAGYARVGRRVEDVLEVRSRALDVWSEAVADWIRGLYDANPGSEVEDVDWQLDGKTLSVSATIVPGSKP